MSVFTALSLVLVVTALSLVLVVNALPLVFVVTALSLLSVVLAWVSFVVASSFVQLDEQVEALKKWQARCQGMHVASQG